MRRALGEGPKTLAVSLAILYPGFVYFGLQRWQPRVLACVLLGLLMPSILIRVAEVRREAIVGLAALPLVTGLALLLGVFLNSAGFVLLVPVVVSAGFLTAFGGTLWRGPPMVERFARLQRADLSPAELKWCLLWTRLWCVFFVVNGLLAGALAQWGSLYVWTAYTGLVAYLLMGAMFAVEYTMRKYRFGHFRSHLLDRLLERIYATWRRAQ